MGIGRDLQKWFQICSKVSDEGSRIALNCMDIVLGQNCYWKNEEKAFELCLKSIVKDGVMA